MLQIRLSGLRLKKSLGQVRPFTDWNRIARDSFKRMLHLILGILDVDGVNLVEDLHDSVARFWGDTFDVHKVSSNLFALFFSC